MSSPTLALEKLYRDVVADFSAVYAAMVPPRDPPEQPFGWRAPSMRSSRFRIVWVPGDDDDRTVGVMGPARNPGRNARPLATLHERATVYLEARDDSAPTDELAQWKAARLLFDAWAAAAIRAAHGTIQISDPRWAGDTLASRAGATIRVVVDVDSMIPDFDASTAPVDTSASVSTIEGSQTDGPDTVIATP